MMTEETKPVEREAFDKAWEAIQAIPVHRLTAKKAAEVAWDAALGRAVAVLRAHPGYFRNRYVSDDAISAIEALKGSC